MALAVRQTPRCVIDTETGRFAMNEAAYHADCARRADALAALPDGPTAGVNYRFKTFKGYERRI